MSNYDDEFQGVVNDAKKTIKQQGKENQEKFDNITSTNFLIALFFSIFMAVLTKILTDSSFLASIIDILSFLSLFSYLNNKRL